MKYLPTWRRFLRLNISVIFAETFQSLKHFGHLSHSWIKTRQKCFLAYILRHSDRNDLIFLGHFKNDSVCGRKKQPDAILSGGPRHGLPLAWSQDRTPQQSPVATARVKCLSMGRQYQVHTSRFVTSTTRPGRNALRSVRDDPADVNCPGTMPITPSQCWLHLDNNASCHACSGEHERWLRGPDSHSLLVASEAEARKSERQGSFAVLNINFQTFFRPFSRLWLFRMTYPGQIRALRQSTRWKWNYQSWIKCYENAWEKIWFGKKVFFQTDISKEFFHSFPDSVGTLENPWNVLSLCRLHSSECSFVKLIHTIALFLLRSEPIVCDEDYPPVKGNDSTTFRFFSVPWRFCSCNNFFFVL